MYFLIRFDVTHPPSVSLAQFHAIWDEEAKATQGARDAGVLQGWKVVGQRVIVAIGQFDTHDALDRTLMELPIMKRLGGAVTVEVLPIRPYDAFAADLAELAEGVLLEEVASV